MHPEGQRPLGHQASDPAQPHDAEGLAVKFDAFPLRAPPVPRLEVGVGLRDVPGLGDQQGDGVLGSGEDVRLRGVDHHHALAGGRGNVDVVEADPRPADHHQLRARLEHVGRDLCGAADDERRCTPDRAEQLLRRHPDGHVDVEAGGGERVETHLSEGFGDQNARSHER
jgi:hypothetical protein